MWFVFHFVRVNFTNVEKEKSGRSVTSTVETPEGGRKRVCTKRG